MAYISNGIVIPGNYGFRHEYQNIDDRYGLSYLIGTDIFDIENVRKYIKVPNDNYYANGSLQLEAGEWMSLIPTRYKTIAVEILNAAFERIRGMIISPDINDQFLNAMRDVTKKFIYEGKFPPVDGNDVIKGLL